MVERVKRIAKSIDYSLRNVDGHIDMVRVSFFFISLVAVFFTIWFIYQFYFYGSPPLAHNGLATVDATSYEPGDNILVGFDYCSYIEDSATLRIRWVNNITFNEQERLGVVYREGCTESGIIKTVPPLPPGEYHLQWELSYRLPVRHRQVIIPSEPFTILDPDE